MGERPDRPDELRRDLLGGETGRDVDPADAREIELEPPPPPFDPEAASPDPALTSGGARVDEVEANRAEIERTRADMSETVDAIQNKFSP